MKRENFYKAVVLSLCCAGTAYAHAPMPVNPDRIGVELTGGWFRGMAADTDFGIQAQNTTDLPPSGSLLRVTPDTKFGGEIGLYYDFGASPYTVGLTWWRAHSNSDDSAAGSIGLTQLPATWAVDFAAATNSTLEYENDVVSLLLGASFRPHCAWSVAPQLGISYLRIKNDQTTTYTGNDVGASSLITLNENSSFKGYGPSFGVNLDYTVVEHFSVFGKFLYSAFLGNIDANYNPVQTGATSRSANVDISNDKQIVNLIQTELGLAYHFMCVDYDSQILLGYAFAKIFGGSENNAYFGDDVADSLFTSSTTDLGFQGPFVRFTINFDL